MPKDASSRARKRAYRAVAKLDKADRIQRDQTRGHAHAPVWLAPIMMWFESVMVDLKEDPYVKRMHARAFDRWETRWRKELAFREAVAIAERQLCATVAS